MSSEQSVLAVFLAAWKGEGSKRRSFVKTSISQLLGVCQNEVFLAWLSELWGEGWETSVCDKQINQKTLPE